MGAETPIHGSSRAPRPAGKRLPEKRQGFLIYLPQATHAKLKAEATRRVITMSELALTAIAQYLSVEEPPGRVPSPPEPFVGQYGVGRSVPRTPAPSAADPSVVLGSEQDTFEVDE